MNTGLCIYDLSPECRDALVERTLADMRKTLQLTRITRHLSMPANAAGYTPPCPAAEAGAFHMEQIA